MSAPWRDGSARVEALSALLAEAWRTGAPVPLDDDLAALSVAEAYRVQDAVAAGLGWFARGRPTAWKVGTPSRAQMPTAAPLPDACVRASSARIGPPRIARLGIEAEIAVRLGPAVERIDPAAAIPPDALAGAVESIGVAIEVVDARLAAGDRAPAACKLADLQFHGALVLGAMRAFDPGHDWRHQPCRVFTDGRELAAAEGSHPCADPLFALPWLIGHAAARGTALRAGDLVTTGAWTGMHAVPAGSRVVVSFPGIGEAALELLPQGSAG